MPLRPGVESGCVYPWNNCSLGEDFGRSHPARELQKIVGVFELFVEVSYLLHDEL